MEGGENYELSSSVFISYLFSFLVAISDNWLVRFCPCDNPTLTQAVTYNNVHILRLGWARSPSNIFKWMIVHVYNFFFFFGEECLYIFKHYEKKNRNTLSYSRPLSGLVYVRYWIICSFQ